jgi:hypothetical protein
MFDKLLPIELKLMVFGSVDPLTMLKLRSVSRELSDWVSDRYLWKMSSWNRHIIRVPTDTEPEIIVKQLCAWYRGVIQITYTDHYIGKKYDFSRIEKITNDNKFVELDLSWCTGIISGTNLQALKDCRSLNLSMTGYTDFESVDYGIRDADIMCLKNIHSLNLTRCRGVTDVNALENVHKLNLALCENVKRVNQLENCRYLNLYGCLGIIDILLRTNHEMLSGTIITYVNDGKWVPNFRLIGG